MNMSRSKQKRNRKDNPAKSALERKGIKFPQRSAKDRSAETQVNKPSPILHTATRDEKEGAEQLGIVMRESLHHEAANSTAAFHFFESDWYSGISLHVLGHPPLYYPSYNYEMTRIKYTPSFYQPRPTSTCTLTTSTSTNSAFTDCTPSSESQTKPSEEEAAHLLLSLSQRHQPLGND